MSDLERLFPDLARLGVRGNYTRAEQVHIPDVAPTDVGHGLGVAELDVDAILKTETCFAERSDLAALAGTGLRAKTHERRPEVLKLLAEGADRPLSILQGGRGLAAHEGAVGVDLSVFSGPALLRGDDEQTLYVLRRPAQARALEVDVFVAPLALPERPEVRSDVRAWAKGDPWIADEVERRLATGDPVDHAEAVGHAWRFRAYSAEETRRVVELVREGRSLDELFPGRGWAQRLPEVTARWVELRAVTTAGRLADTLEALVDDVDTRDAGWRADLTRLLVERDDLESVRLVLRAASACDRLDRALARLDRDGDVAMRSLPRWRPDMLPEQLRRAAGKTHDAWWVQPVVDEGEAEGDILEGP